MITVQLTGLEELKRKMAEMPDKIDRAVVRGSLVEGARLIRDDARQRAPMYHGAVSAGHPPPGTLKKAIIIKYIPERSRGGRFEYIVGVRHGKQFQHFGKKGVNRDAFYWWFVENGHYTRAAREFVRGKGKAQRVATSTPAGKIRFVAGIRFMRGAFQTQKEAAVRTILQTMRDGISAAVA